MSICSTSFQGIDLVHVSKAIKLMGECNLEYECIALKGLQEVLMKSILHLMRPCWCVTPLYLATKSCFMRVFGAFLLSRPTGCGIPSAKEKSCPLDRISFSPSENQTSLR